MLERRAAQQGTEQLLTGESGEHTEYQGAQGFSREVRSLRGMWDWMW